MPRIHIRTSRIGLPKLAISRRYYKIFFPNYFRKSRPPIAPLEFCPRAKSYFRWSSTYQFFQINFGLDTVCFLFFCCFLFFIVRTTNKFRTSENNKNIFFILSLLGFILQRLCQTSTPCRVPSKELISWDFRPWKSAGGRTPQTCPAPAPTCAGIKYPVRGNPSLWCIFWMCLY